MSMPISSRTFADMFGTRSSATVVAVGTRNRLSALYHSIEHPSRRRRCGTALLSKTLATGGSGCAPTSEKSSAMNGFLSGSRSAGKSDGCRPRQRRASLSSRGAER